MSQPLIGVSGCAIEDEKGRYTYKVGDKYVNAIAQASGATPIVIPPMGTQLDLDLLLDRIDGLFLTGSPSNVEPGHYDGPEFRDTTKRDPLRDATTLPLVEKVIERGMPLLAVCRGHQELNVALGGTLHQHVEELPGKLDHRMKTDIGYNDQYDVAHTISVHHGGLLASLNGGAGQVSINSLHSQGIDRLSDRLAVEATAPDGIIEAVSMPSAPGFVLGVQWHPEHPVALQWPLSQAIFTAFGKAARTYVENRNKHGKAA